MAEKKSHIFIVEDEAIIFLDLRRSLQRMGYQVDRSVSSGEQALEILEKQKFDLVLMDIQLSGKMTGIETARIIKTKYNIPVVYLTAYADEKTLKNAAETQPYGYLYKPFEERELKITIEMALFKHEMETRLLETENRFRELFEQNNDAIVLFSRDNFDIIDFNPATLSIFQFTREELKESFHTLFQDEDTFNLFKKEITDFFEKKGDVFFDRCILKRKDDAEVVCSVRVNPIKLHPCDVFYCVFRDITEHSRIEVESRELEARLLHTNRMTSLGTLASGIAHEINNPNNFILSNTQIVKKIWEDIIHILQDYYDQNGDFNPGGLSFIEVKELVPKLLQSAIDGSCRIKAITDNFKAFSKPEQTPQHEEVDINRIIEFSISILSNEIKSLTDSFSFVPGEKLPHVLGNPQQLEQVFINLIQNALQSLPARSSGVSVLSGFNKKTNQVVVTVMDEGVGIHNKLLGRITEPFFTTRLEKGGTGLGLYISYSIVKAHQGTLDFFSSPGQGTSAVVSIPVMRASLLNQRS